MITSKSRKQGLGERTVKWKVEVCSQSCEWMNGSTFPFSDVEHGIHRFHLSWESGLSSGSAMASKNLESALRNTWWPRFWLSLIHSFKYPTTLMDKWSIITLIILRDVAIPLVPFQRVFKHRKKLQNWNQFCWTMLFFLNCSNEQLMSISFQF